ncbi:MAG TPA: hypothetical protein VK509_10315, partial [Polyangiales bacterium]|nr:hypothetical protein [Polyangiales bacterium]
ADPNACTGARDLDLLIIVDTSASMREERMALAGQLQDLFRGLTVGDIDADGTAEFAGFRSVHAGLVTTDLGAGATGIQGLDFPTFCDTPGDDAVLQNRGDNSQLGCAASYTPPFVNATASMGAADVAARDIECMFRGIDVEGGCGFEHPLEAALKALSSEDQPWRFLWTTPQGEQANRGFLRKDALLAVLVMTDEDDCSFLDLDAARTGSPRFPGHPASLRCALAPEALMPLSRFFHGLRGLKQRPTDVVFGAIAGVPEELVASNEPGVYAQALADQRMVLALDGSEDDPVTTLVPACTQGEQSADPARRLLELADMFGKRGIMQSICAASIRPALHAFARTIGQAVSEPDCTSSDCPCQPPFVCKDERCTCDATVQCEPGTCDAIADGCGGPHYCESCPGTLSCAALGHANQCETTSTCAPGHVCMRVYFGTAAPEALAHSALWFFRDLADDGFPDPVMRMTTGMAVPVRDEVMMQYSYDFDLTGFDFSELPEVYVALATSANDLANGPEPGDQWYVHPSKLRLAPGWLADLGQVFALQLIPLTADKPLTSGHEGEGLIHCGAGACRHSCCDDVCSGSGCDAMAVKRISCDGPEDCTGGQICCGQADRSETFCSAAELCTLRVCHADDQCVAPQFCNPIGTPISFCQ